MSSQLVSIVVPCYNQAQYLSETLQSVLDQTYNNWECILVNDGSTDNTEEMALIWCKKDTRFVYLKKENGGLSSARNAGLNIAKGNYIQFLDSDDLIKPEKITTQLLDLNESQISVCDYFPYRDGSNEFVKNRYLSPFLNENSYKKDVILDWEYKKSIPCHSVLFKRELVVKYKLYFDETLPNHEDWVFWVKLFYFSTSIKNNSNILAHYRIQNASMCSDLELMKYGFLKATDNLLEFFKENGDNEFVKYVSDKHKQITNRGKKSLVVKLKIKIYRIISYILQYVKKN